MWDASIAFGPEALSRFTQILEEVTVDLVDDGVPVERVRSAEIRTRLAQRLLGFASSWRTDTQIKQLLLRALRNEISASRVYAAVSVLRSADGELTAYEAVSLMTGSDDTALDDVSV